MADTNLPVTPGSGTNVDGYGLDNSNFRQSVVIGSPTTAAAVAPVDATKGLAVDLAASGSNTNPINVSGVTVDGTTAETNFLVIGGETSDATAQYQPIPLSAGGVSVHENINQVGGSSVSTVAAGVQKVGIAGSSAATLDGVITAATAPANGLAVLTVAQTSAPSLTVGQSVAMQCDYTGSLFVKPHRRSETTSKATTIAASTTPTTVLAAQASGIFADISSLIISVTAAATVTSFTCTLSDGTNSYIFDVMTGLTTTATPGLAVNAVFNPPLPATNAATAWTVTNSSATPTVHITVVAVLQKAS